MLHGARLATDGWVDVDGPTRDAYEEVIAWLKSQGVAILAADDHPAIAAFESAISGARKLCHDLCE